MVDLVHRDAMFAPLGPEDEHAADDKGERDRYRVEQVGLDGLYEQYPENRRGQERDDEVGGEALCAALAR